MPDEYNWILQSFSNKEIGIVISDRNTLCLGIDLFARLCFNKVLTTIKIKSDEYLQMAGRAFK